MGSARASRAVFRALAENFECSNWFQTFGVAQNGWTRFQTGSARALAENFDCPNCHKTSGREARPATPEAGVLPITHENRSLPNFYHREHKELKEKAFYLCALCVFAVTFPDLHTP